MDVVAARHHAAGWRRRRFRARDRRDNAIGIIFVTKRNRDADRIRGLEAAGDDYVTKPINLRELLARVRALCRRAGSTGASRPRTRC
ncbi:MAG: hypothetical protein WDN69_10330 [Aliidongia sp.]